MLQRTRASLRAVVILVLVAGGIGSALSGCGKKGPLYLPDQHETPSKHR